MHPASWTRAPAASSRTTFLTTQDSPGWADARPQLVLGSQYNVRWHGLGLVALSGPRGNVCLHLAPSDVWRLGCTREDFLVRNVDSLSGTHGCLCELFVIYTVFVDCLVFIEWKREYIRCMWRIIIHLIVVDCLEESDRKVKYLLERQE